MCRRRASTQARIVLPSCNIHMQLLEQAIPQQNPPYISAACMDLSSATLVCLHVRSDSRLHVECQQSNTPLLLLGWQFWPCYQCVCCLADGKIVHSFCHTIHLCAVFFMVAVLLCMLPLWLLCLKAQSIRSIKVAGPPAQTALCVTSLSGCRAAV